MIYRSFYLFDLSEAFKILFSSRILPVLLCMWIGPIKFSFIVPVVESGTGNFNPQKGQTLESTLLANTISQFTKVSMV